MQSESSRTGIAATPALLFGAPDRHFKGSFPGEASEGAGAREAMKPFDQTPRAGSVAVAIRVDDPENSTEEATEVTAF